MIEIINELAQWLLILLLFSSTGKLWKAMTSVKSILWPMEWSAHEGRKG